MRDVIDFQAVEIHEGTNELACLGRSRSTQKAYDLSIEWKQVLRKPQQRESRTRRV